MKFIYRRYLPESGLGNCIIGGGIVGPFELFDGDDDELLLLTKCRCVCEWE